MKKSIFLVIGLIVLLASFNGTQDKPITVTMSVQEWETVFNIIDNSTTPGEVRKPLLQKIATQVQAQTQPPKVNQPVQKDSTKPKKQ